MLWNAIPSWSSRTRMLMTHAGRVDFTFGVDISLSACNSSKKSCRSVVTNTGAADYRVSTHLKAAPVQKFCSHEPELVSSRPESFN